MSRVRSITELCGLRVSVESYLAPKGPTQCKRCQRFGHTQLNCGYAPRCIACGGYHLSGGCSNPREQPQCCDCGSNHIANYRGCVKWKDAKEALAKQAPQRAPRNAATGHPTAPKAQQAGPTAEQLALGEGWSHVARGGRVAKATATTPPPNPNPLLNRSRRCPGSLTSPPTGRRPGLGYLSPNPQLPLNRLQGSQKRN